MKHSPNRATLPGSGTAVMFRVMKSAFGVPGVPHVQVYVPGDAPSPAKLLLAHIVVFERKELEA